MGVCRGRRQEQGHRLDGRREPDHHVRLESDALLADDVRLLVQRRGADRLTLALLSRWRRASYSSTAAATDTLRLSAMPSMGRATGSTSGPAHVSVRPSASLPRTSASGPL